MNLWIRSQDREMLINNPELEIYKYGNEKFLVIDTKCNITYDKAKILGEYKTKERALEVLEEISLRISTINLLSLTTCSEDLKLMVKALTKERFKGITRPYEMPEE